MYAQRILLVGGGRMGGALAAGWLNAPHLRKLYVIEPSPEAASRLPLDERLSVIEGAEALPPGEMIDALVLAVKPQLMAGVAPRYAALARPGTLVLSIAAGQTIANLAGHLGPDAVIVRAMPNTPAMIGAGISVCCAGPLVGDSMRQRAHNLMSAVGEVAWLADEALMDVVTGLSGSGPAYVFLLIEVLAEAGVRLGLPADLALRLARSTVSGSGRLAEHDTTSSPADLRAAVTSPGGTTAAALEVLLAEPGLQALFDAAVGRAVARGRELAGG